MINFCEQGVFFDMHANIQITRLTTFNRFARFLGAIVLTGLGEIFTDVGELLHVPGTKQIFYGLALMVIVMYRPAGVWPCSCSTAPSA